MKVTIEKIMDSEQEAAHLKVVAMTEEIQSAIELLQNNSGRIAAIQNGQTILCPVSSIYYLESVDRRTFIYLKDECLETKYRLYELEMLLNANFFRCSKGMIVNLKKIRSVKSELNGRMNAQMLNGEEIVISRSYVKALKRRIGA